MGPAAALVAALLSACGPTGSAHLGSPAAKATMLAGGSARGSARVPAGASSRESASASSRASAGTSAKGSAGASSRGPAAGSARGPAGVLAATGPVVALGDSYTAGDLVPLSLTSRPPGCLRSSDGYPAQVARALGASARFIDASCTGAGVKDMTAPERTYLGTNLPQLSALAPDDSVVMLTLGGDDMGFAHGIDICMALSVTDPFGSPCQNHFSGGGTDQLAARAAAEGPKMVAVLDEIHARAPRARVLLVGYPDLFPQQGGCWPVVPITKGDLGYLLGIETRLNAVLARAAQVAGATFVNTYTPTIGHDFCQSAAVKDVEGLVPTSATAPFHPNARGQATIAALVLAALRSDPGQGAS